MRKTRKLCAIMLDTLGREVMIRRPFRIDPGGWPNQAGQEIEIKTGQMITLTTQGRCDSIISCLFCCIDHALTTD
jgi:pyruvate kinase